MTNDDPNKLHEEIKRVEEELGALREKRTELIRQFPREEVKDYTLYATDGSEVSLSSLFGDKSDLILIHNMGRSCPYCTLWADGFNGLVHHFENRAAFVLVSPDAPDVQREFAASRDWKFRTISGHWSSFIKDMGYETDDGHFMPGYSNFHKDADGKIYRVAHDFFGPGDYYNPVWHFFDLLKDGVDNWQPKFAY